MPHSWCGLYCGKGFKMPPVVQYAVESTIEAIGLGALIGMGVALLVVLILGIIFVSAWINSGSH